MEIFCSIGYGISHDGQPQLAGDQAREQRVAEGGEGLGLG